MQPIATDGVAWSLSLCHDSKPCKKTTKPIKMPFGTWTRVGQRNEGATWGRERADPGHAQTCLTDDILERLGRQCGCRLGCTRWGAHWSHLANITELPVCNVALCQITLTTYWALFILPKAGPNPATRTSDNDKMAAVNVKFLCRHPTDSIKAPQLNTALTIPKTIINDNKNRTKITLIVVTNKWHKNEDF